MVPRFLLLLAVSPTVALAADYTPPPPVSPMASWTAVYAGLHAGGLWGLSDWQFGNAPINAGPFQVQTSGFLGGGQIGANYQLSGLPLVVGVEAEISAVSASGAGVGVSGSPRTITSIAGRAGLVSNATTLVFVKAGPAWLRTNYESIPPAFSTPASTFTPNIIETKSGVLAGVGAEFLVTPSWSAKLEYDYMDFGSSTVNFGNAIAPLGAPQTYTVRQRDHAVKFGINYLFGR